MLFLGLGLTGCSKQDQQGSKLAPKVAPPAPLPKKAESKTLHHFDVDTKKAKVEFAMDAPLEKIRGRVPSSAVSGAAWVEKDKGFKISGAFRVALNDLELFQRKAKKGGKFGEEVKNDTQNKHARNWLEIDEDAPAQERKKNLLASFSFEKLTQLSSPKLKELAPGEHKTEWRAQGPFIIHQRAQELQATLTIVLEKQADGALRLKQIATAKPIPIDLEKFDVRPRTAFGKLAQKSLSMMSEKVAQVADLSVSLALSPRSPAKPR